MTKAKGLNIKNMKETLVNYCGGDEKEFDKIWDGFRLMALTGFITDDTWRKFWTECQGWTIIEDKLIDIRWDDNGEAVETVIFDFDNARNGGEYQEYRA